MRSTQRKDGNNRCRGKTDTTGKEETKEDDGGSAEAHGRIRGIFVLLGIMISQAFMLAGFLLVALYFVFDVLSRKEYEYILDGKHSQLM